MLAVALVISLVALSLNASAAQAATAAVDQQCSTIGSSYLAGVGTHQPAGQTFIPMQSSMTGLAFYLRSDNPTATSMTANIISNGILGVNNGQGSLAGTVTFTVPALYGQPDGAWLNVPLPSGIVLTPGAVYAINLVDNSGSGGINWTSCSTPYTNGCGYANGQCQASSWVFIDYYGDFSVAFSTSGISIAQGASGTVNLYVASLNNFASPLSLTFSAPPGVAASFNGPSEIETSAGGTSSPTVTIYVAGTVAAGTYPFTVKAISGGITHVATLQLIVTPSGTIVVTPPTLDFLTQPSPGVMTLTPSVSKSTTIVLSSVNGFSSSISLSAAWSGTAPSGVAITLPSPVTVPAGGSSSAILTLTADNSPSTGTYALAVTATNGIIAHTSDISVIIAGMPSILAPVAPDFSISSSVVQPSPATMSLTPATSQSATIILSSLDGLGSTVSLTAGWSEAAPSGVTVSPPNPVIVTVPEGGSSSVILTLTTNGSPSTGSYTLLITATNDVISHSTEIPVVIASTPTVLAPVTPAAVPIQGFAVQPSTDTVSTIQGLSGEASVIVDSQAGFSAPVAFSVSWVGNAPADIGVNVPQTVTPPAGGEASSPISFTTTALTPTGTYIAQVTATSGSISHSTDITLQVNSPSPFVIWSPLSNTKD